MDESLKSLRVALADCRGEGSGYGVRYPSALRQEVVAYTRSRPESPGQVARLLGISAVTLERWQDSIPAVGFRPVAVVQAADSAGVIPESRGGLCLVTPKGFRIEGLDLATMRDLLGSL